jgi:hypothetical protein
MFPIVGENHPLQFCALEYSPQGLRIAASSVDAVVLIVVRAEDETLRFLLHPEWRTVIQHEDLPYFESLLSDFLERAKVDPEPLFNQLCSLGVGPLVTREAGLSLSNHPNLMELCSGFVPLE